ncbi:DUF6190 family protein [Streptomyces sp. NPDC006482]|uniref:DUF6190 family protein n=1 Tax=unclassified Streptomyces TaxID=2593676 RepID=UPI00224F28E7|nr:DUF6190 family protein [Streptomyces sp. NBC_00094]MCX5389207.1 DUF6190 family protein [Streptomyces sp. NBC_00094]
MPADATGAESAESATAHDDFIDAALFLGMHSADEGLRVAAKAFFVRRLDARVVMSLEQVGRCDDVIWGYSRELQDLYYPFMDHLHTVMHISREGYDRADVRLALSDSDTPRHLPFVDRMLLGQVINRKGLLHTAGPRSSDVDGLPVRAVAAWPAGEPEPSFPEPLEQLYRASLALRLPLGHGAAPEGA